MTFSLVLRCRATIGVIINTPTGRLVCFHEKKHRVMIIQFIIFIFITTIIIIVV